MFIPPYWLYYSSFASVSETVCSWASENTRKSPYSRASISLSAWVSARSSVRSSARAIVSARSSVRSSARAIVNASARAWTSARIGAKIWTNINDR